MPNLNRESIHISLGQSQTEAERQTEIERALRHTRQVGSIDKQSTGARFSQTSHYA